MKTTTRLAVVGAVAALTASSAFLSGSADAAIAHHSASADGTRAVFVQTDEPAGNHVIAYHRNSDGGLVEAGSYSTGGTGGILAGSVVDHTASQGALTYDSGHHLLYAVNAGSDSLSVFTVAGDRLHLVQTIATRGSFPVSVTASGSRVFVLNARDGGSIQGYQVEGRHLDIRWSWHRELNLATGTAPEFTHTPGQVAFAPSGRQLVVTTKAGGNSVEVFNLKPSGLPGWAPVVTSLPGAVPFAVSWDPAGQLAVVEAGTNALATFTLHHDGALTALSSVPSGQSASCWVVANRRNLYVSNAGSASLTQYRSGPRGSLTLVGDTTTDAGTVDATVSPDGHNLYVQAGANGLVDEYRIGWGGSLTWIGT
ncbi:MAG: lactonase family protein, partial [Nocardioidaceae bacterium]